MPYAKQMKTRTIPDNITNPRTGTSDQYGEYPVGKQNPQPDSSVGDSFYTDQPAGTH